MTRHETYAPGQPTAWDVSSGEVPPLARNDLVARGIDPDDPPAVLAFYTSGYFALAERQPYWLPEWTLANAALKRLP